MRPENTSARSITSQYMTSTSGPTRRRLGAAADADAGTASDLASLNFCERLDLERSVVDRYLNMMQAMERVIPNRNYQTSDVQPQGYP